MHTSQTPEPTWDQSGYMRRMPAIWGQVSVHPYCTSEQFRTVISSSFVWGGGGSSVADSSFEVQFRHDEPRASRWRATSRLSDKVNSLEYTWSMNFPPSQWGVWLMHTKLILTLVFIHRIISRSHPVESTQYGQDSPASPELAKNAMLRRIPGTVTQQIGCA